MAYVTTADGQQHKIVDATLPQSNWQDNATMSFACPEEEEAVACRIELQNQHNMNIGQIKLYSAARKNSWESEAGWTLRSFERTADDVKQKSEAYFDRDKVFDLTERMGADGHLIWNAPEEKEWTILRIGHSKTPPPRAKGRDGSATSSRPRALRRTLRVTSAVWPMALSRADYWRVCYSTVGSATRKCRQ